MDYTHNLSAWNVLFTHEHPFAVFQCNQCETDFAMALAWFGPIRFAATFQESKSSRSFGKCLLCCFFFVRISGFSGRDCPSDFFLSYIHFFSFSYQRSTRTRSHWIVCDYGRSFSITAIETLKKQTTFESLHLFSILFVEFTRCTLIFSLLLFPSSGDSMGWFCCCCFCIVKYFICLISFVLHVDTHTHLHVMSRLKIYTGQPRIICIF